MLDNRRIVITTLSGDSEAPQSPTRNKKGTVGRILARILLFE